MLKNFLKLNLLILLIFLVSIGSNIFLKSLDEAIDINNKAIFRRAYAIMHFSDGDFSSSYCSSTLIKNTSLSSFYLTANHCCPVLGQDVVLSNPTTKKILLGSVYKKAPYPGPDLCLIRAERSTEQPIEVLNSSNDPYYGQQVYSISTPENQVGQISEGRTTSYDFTQNWPLRMTSLLAYGGSSGGGILDKNNNLIGIISMVATNGPSYVYAVNLMDIREFINKNLPKQEK